LLFNFPYRSADERSLFKKTRRIITTREIIHKRGIMRKKKKGRKPAVVIKEVLFLKTDDHTAPTTGSDGVPSKPQLVTALA